MDHSSGGMSIVGEAVPVGGGAEKVYRKSLYLSLNFAGNLKLLFKKKKS